MSVNTFFFVIRENGLEEVSETTFCGIGNCNRSGWGYDSDIDKISKKELLEWLPSYRKQFIENYDGDEKIFNDRFYDMILKNLEQYNDDTYFRIEFF